MNSLQPDGAPENVTGDAERKIQPGIPAPASGPRAYFITFTGYGTWLHGDADGSVDREHNVYGTLVCKPDPHRQSAERFKMDQPPYDMDNARRAVVLAAIREVCVQRRWWLFAAHIRTNHVHVVVQAGDSPEKVMNDLKTYASRHLNIAGLDNPGRRRWARHGSTRYVWNREQLQRAIHYVLHEQGEPMSVYAGPGVRRE